MKFSTVLGFLAIGAIAAPVEEVESVDIEARGNLPGLNAVQTKYANAIIAKSKAEKVGAHGCQAAIATALVEVST